MINRYDDPVNASPSRIAGHLRPWDDEMMIGEGMFSINAENRSHQLLEYESIVNKSLILRYSNVLQMDIDQHRDVLM